MSRHDTASKDAGLTSKGAFNNQPDFGPQGPPPRQQPGRLSLANLIGGGPDVSPIISMILAALLAGLVVALVWGPWNKLSTLLMWFGDLLACSPQIRIGIIWFFCWGMIILLVKMIRFREQKLLIQKNLVPAYLTQISREEAQQMLETIPRRVKFFSTKILALRIVEVLEIYVSGGLAQAAADVARDSAALEAEKVKSSYSFIRMLNRGLLMLGLVGLVLSISSAVMLLSGLIENAESYDALRGPLVLALRGLEVGIDSLLGSLMAMLVLSFFAAPMQRREANLVRDVEHIVLIRLISKLERQPRPDPPSTSD